MEERDKWSSAGNCPQLYPVSGKWVMGGMSESGCSDEDGSDPGQQEEVGAVAVDLEAEVVDEQSSEQNLQEEAAHALQLAHAPVP